MTTIHTPNYYTPINIIIIIITIIILCSLYKIQKTIRMMMMWVLQSNLLHLSTIPTKILNVKINRYCIHTPIALLVLTETNK